MSAIFSSSSSAAGFSFHFGGVRLLRGTRVVGDRVERVADDLLGELTWRVVGAGGAAVERLGDEQGAGQDHERVAAQVLAQQRVVGSDAIEQRVVAAACGA